MRQASVALNADEHTGDFAVELNAAAAAAGAGAGLALFLADGRSERTALVSSFGAESAALIHLCVSIRPDLPVVFVDTHKHFSQTIAYRDLVAERLGLRNLVTVEPDRAAMRAADGDGRLWQRDPDACCTLRKVAPLGKALAGFDAWISGRKAFHGGGRSGLEFAEMQDGRLKINPLFDWSQRDIDDYFERHDLPRHPLDRRGFPSVGCINCTRPAARDKARAGRWQGTGKTECGIHISATGSVSRALPRH
jgi:phosphoadenosine phosphosulfate reductase